MRLRTLFALLCLAFCLYAIVVTYYTVVVYK